MKKYSEFINFPIYLWASKEVDVEVPADEDEGESCMYNIRTQLSDLTIYKQCFKILFLLFYYYYYYFSIVYIITIYAVSHTLVHSLIS